MAKKREKSPSLKEYWHPGKEKRKNRRERSREREAEKKVVPTFSRTMRAQTGSCQRMGEPMDRMPQREETDTSRKHIT